MTIGNGNLNPDRLFSSDPSTRKVSREIYQTIENLPIISPHGHTDPLWFSNNKPFPNPTNLFLTPDHYFFRMLHSQGMNLDDLNIPRLDKNNFLAEKSVWKKFIQFVDQYNWKGTQWFAPIPAGWNIVGFDMVIINRLCKEYGPFNKDRNQQKLFHAIYKIDMMDNYFMWTEADPSVKSISMDATRERMGMSKENAHDALQDVKDTANVMIKFMKTHRAVYQNLKLDKAFANGNSYI